MQCALAADRDPAPKAARRREAVGATGEGKDMSIQLTQSFTVITCTSCGVPFAVPDDFVHGRSGRGDTPQVKLPRDVAEAVRGR